VNPNHLPPPHDYADQAYERLRDAPNFNINAATFRASGLTDRVWKAAGWKRLVVCAVLAVAVLILLIWAVAERPTEAILYFVLAVLV
jgi:hypothetical protein